MVLSTRRMSVLAIALALLGTSMALSGTAVAKPTKVQHAGVVVQHGDLGTLTDCVAFTEHEIDGLELVKRSRFEYRSAKFPEGTGICWLDGEGCKTTRSDQCFCTPVFGTTASWSYWVQHRSDEPMIHHGETYPSERVIHDGSVDYWTFGPHGMPPASIHAFGDICGDAAASSDTAEDLPTAPVVLAMTRKSCSLVTA